MKLRGIVLFRLFACVCAFTLHSGLTWAVPYASAVRNTTGTEYEFVLNEPADSISILRDGGNEVLIDAPMAGRHTFDLESYSDFEISVANDAPAEWTEISDAGNLHTYYYRPNGVVVNNDPASELFGTVYVSHPVNVEQAPNVERELGRGIYSLSSDLIGVDLANNYGVRSEANDNTLAVTPPGWTISENDSSSPWQLALDESNNLIASDYSDEHGGFKYASPDLTDGGLVLAFEDGVLPLLINDNGEEIHGSIISKPSVTGSVGKDLTIRGIDEDMDVDRDTFENDADYSEAVDDGYSLWRWDVGAATEYDQPPALEIASPAINVDEALWFDGYIDVGNGPEFVPGIDKDAHYEPQFDKWYLTQSRTHGNESSLIIVSSDGVDGMSPTIEWASRQFSLDNELDGAIPNAATDTDDELALIDGPQDIFRSLGSVTISADGTKMFVHRAQQFDDDSDDGSNPYLGSGSDYPGGVLVIPLDENGLPDVEIDDNGTPEDTTDDRITNFESVSMEGELTRHVRAPIALDAAGNAYVTNNISELLQVFSPGGNTLAVTGSDGTFDVQTIVDGGGLDGDYNDDGVVNAADYVLFRNNLDQAVTLPNDVTPGMVDASDYTVWVNNFGNTATASSQAAVPEPGGFLLLLSVWCGAVVWAWRYRPQLAAGTVR